MAPCSIRLVAYSYLLFLHLVYHSAAFPRYQRTGDRVCLTPDCVIRSATVLEALDPSIDPCEDFFGYACGRWGEQQGVARGRDVWNNFYKLSEKNMEILIQELERNSSKIQERESEAVKKAKRFYASCLDESANSKAAAGPVFQILEELGGWELIDGDVATRSNHGNRDNIPGIPRLIASIHKMDSYPLFGMEVGPDYQNSSRNIITVFQSGLGMVLEDYYLNTDQMEEDAYIEFGLDIVSLLQKEKAEDNHEGVFMDLLADIFSSVLPGDAPSISLPGDHPSSLIDVLERMVEITMFEAQLARAYVPENEIRDPAKTYQKMTLEEFATSMTRFDVLEYFDEIFGEEIPLDEEIAVCTPSYFTKLDNVLDSVTDQVLRAYALWYLVQDLVYFLPAPYRMALRDFLETLQGVTAVTPHLDPGSCATLTDTAMGMVTGALYVERHSEPKTKAEIGSMIDLIRHQFIDSIPWVEWMDAGSKDAARRKAYSMGKKISYPPWILDAEVVDQRYQDITMSSSILIVNVIELRRAGVEKMLTQRGKPVNKGLWFMSPAETNAYYTNPLNEIVFLAGILQPPFYDSSLPRSMQFGAIGTIIGHELVHAFDASGKEYDEYGNLNDWWNEEAEAAYTNRAQCLVDQYANFTLGKLHLDGEKTLNENIADNEGYGWLWGPTTNGYCNIKTRDLLCRAFKI